MATNTLKPATRTTQGSITYGQAAAYGAVGGLIGGMIFGMMMSMLDMIKMVAMMADSESIVDGWGLHLGISVFIGVTFGLLARKVLTSWGAGIAAAVGYGVFWWVLGALILMPARLGMPTFAFNTMAWQSLMGHMVFGLILGAVTVAIARRSLASSGASN